MASLIHPTAIIDPTAKLGTDVQVGPFCVIHANAEIGNGTRLDSHVIVEANTIIGENCHLSPGAAVGGEPQDLAFKGEFSRVRIGNNTHIREYATIHRASGENEETVVGNDCMLMAYTHVAHNCKLGNNVILANTVQLGGYVELGDYVFLGGAVVVHQFVRIGRMAFLGGRSGTRQDVPPFAMTNHAPALVTGLNSVGLRRRGLKLEERTRLKKAFFYLWFAGMNQTQAIEAIRENVEIDAYVQELIDFVQSSKRGVIGSVRTLEASGESTGADADMAAV